MKKINIVSKKTGLTDDKIASVKKPFSEVLKEFQVIPHVNPLLIKSIWWLSCILTVAVITSLVLINSKKLNKQNNVKNPLMDIGNEENKVHLIKSESLKSFFIQEHFTGKNEINHNVNQSKILMPTEKNERDSLKNDTDKVNVQFENTYRKEVKVDRIYLSRMPKCNDFLHNKDYNSIQNHFAWELIEKEGLFGYVTLNGNEVVKPQYTKIYNFGDYHFGWALVEKDNLYGFIASNGLEIVKPQYNSICNFGEYQFGWALVEKDNLYGFIASNGSEIVKPQYNSISNFGEYQFGWALVEKDNLYGFIASNGSEIVKPQYNSIGKFGEYQFGWALVEKENLYGFIASNGSEVVKPQFQKINKFGEYLPFRAVVMKNGFYGLISTNGTLITEPVYESIKDLMKNANE